MNKRLQMYLDGELPFEQLSAEDRAEAEQWDSLLAQARMVGSGPAPSWLETRVMAALPAHPDRVGLKGVLSWLTDPQVVRLRPISVGLVAAAAAFVLFFAYSGPVKIDQGSLNPPANVHTVAAEPASIIYVQFVFASPAASTVTVAGDFNDWDVITTPLTDTDGDGVWTGRVALRPGLHKYMFVVDGEKWITDPQADSYVDDGFGMRNAVLSIAQPITRAI
jgi:hypothetical protein